MPTAAGISVPRDSIVHQTILRTRRRLQLSLLVSSFFQATLVFLLLAFVSRAAQFLQPGILSQEISLLLCISPALLFLLIRTLLLFPSREDAARILDTLGKTKNRAITALSLRDKSHAAFRESESWFSRHQDLPSHVKIPSVFPALLAAAAGVFLLAIPLPHLTAPNPSAEENKLPPTVSSTSSQEIQKLTEKIRRLTEENKTADSPAPQKESELTLPEALSHLRKSEEALQHAESRALLHEEIHQALTEALARESETAPEFAKLHEALESGSLEQARQILEEASPQSIHQLAEQFATATQDDSLQEALSQFTQSTDGDTQALREEMVRLLEQITRSTANARDIRQLAQNLADLREALSREQTGSSAEEEGESGQGLLLTSSEKSDAEASQTLLLTQQVDGSSMDTDGLSSPAPLTPTPSKESEMETSSVFTPLSGIPGEGPSSTFSVLGNGGEQASDAIQNPIANRPGTDARRKNLPMPLREIVTNYFQEIRKSSNQP